MKISEFIQIPRSENGELQPAKLTAALLNVVCSAMRHYNANVVDLHQKKVLEMAADLCQKPLSGECTCFLLEMNTIPQVDKFVIGVNTFIELSMLKETKVTGFFSRKIKTKREDMYGSASLIQFPDPLAFMTNTEPSKECLYHVKIEAMKIFTEDGFNKYINNLLSEVAKLGLSADTKAFSEIVRKHLVEMYNRVPFGTHALLRSRVYLDKVNKLNMGSYLERLSGPGTLKCIAHTGCDLSQVTHKARPIIDLKPMEHVEKVHKLNYPSFASVRNYLIGAGLSALPPEYKEQINPTSLENVAALVYAYTRNNEGEASIEVNVNKGPDIGYRFSVIVKVGTKMITYHMASE